MYLLLVKYMKLWLLEPPFLYELTYLVKDKSGKVLDKIESYTGMVIYFLWNILPDN